MTIKCHYFGKHDNSLDNLKIAHENSVTSSGQKVNLEPGDKIIVCATKVDKLYAFYAQVVGPVEDKTANAYWPTYHRPNDTVTELKVITPVTYVPDSVYYMLFQAGLTNEDKPRVLQYLLDKMPEPEVIPVHPKWEPQAKVEETTEELPEVLKNRIGFVYILKDLQLGGYKIGITTNVGSRFRQLGVPNKAHIVGIWMSDEYKELEKKLHQHFSDERIPQSEWFNLTESKLDWCLEWLAERTGSVKLKVDRPEKEPIKSPVEEPRFRFLSPALAVGAGLALAVLTVIPTIQSAPTVPSPDYVTQSE